VSSLDRLREHPDIARLRERIASHTPVEAEAPGARRAAVSLMLRLGEQSGEPELLFIQRASYESDPWSGQVAFPGGREEPGDESPAQTAIRETWEETGIDIGRDGELIGQLDDLRPQTVRLPAIVVRPFVALLGDHPSPVLSDEVSAGFWVPLASLRDATVWRDTIVTAHGLEFTRRAFHHEDFVVWGMTERILSDFLRLSGLAE
jgi:8-oxo-dGTP pyrophosphatase MutT (NUDIX family)